MRPAIFKTKDEEIISVSPTAIYIMLKTSGDVVMGSSSLTGFIVELDMTFEDAVKEHNAAMRGVDLSLGVPGAGLSSKGDS